MPGVGTQLCLRPGLTTPAAAEQAQEITTVTSVKQSTEIVQTVLHASISALSYMRLLFDPDCFREQYYQTTDTHYPYEDYAAGTQRPTDSSTATASQRARRKRGNGMPINVLKRGHSKRVDKFLDLLEKGAFEALRKGFLRALQLTIVEDPSKPANVVEMYTFTFHYDKASGQASSISGIELTELRSSQPLSIGTAKHSMQTFITKLITMCFTMPDLPPRRYLTVHLLYTEDRDPDYHAPGFHTATDDTVYFPANEWTRVTQNGASMDAGFHTVSLNASYLLPTHSGTADASGIPKDDSIPNNLQYTDAVSREDGVVEMEDIILARVPEQGDITGEKPSLQTQGMNGNPPSTASASPASNGRSMHGLDADVRSNESITTSEGTPLRAVGQNNDRSSIAPPESSQAEQRLQYLLESPHQSIDLEETQPLSQNHRIFGTRIDGTIQTSRLQLSQRKVDEVDVVRSNRPRQTQAVKPQRRNSLDIVRQDSVDCQCGFSIEEDDMVYCSFCDRWQHLHCYGYLGCNDPRLPDTHMCYQCLLQEKEAPLLLHMKGLALLRRSLHLVGVDGFSDDKELSSLLGCEPQIASGLATTLRKEGFLVSTLSSKSKGVRAKSKTRWHKVKTEPALSRMMEKYFDPTVKIAHHFVLPQPKTSALNEETLPRALSDMGDMSLDPLDSISHSEIPETMEEVMTKNPAISEARNAAGQHATGLRTEPRASPKPRQKKSEEATPSQGLHPRHAATRHATGSQGGRYNLRNRDRQCEPQFGSQAVPNTHAADPSADQNSTPKKRGRSGLDDATPGPSKRTVTKWDLSVVVDIGERMSSPCTASQYSDLD